MKYTLLIISLILLQLNLSAQESTRSTEESKSTFLGGTFSIRSEIRDKPSTTYYFSQELAVNINPYYGVELNPKLSFGGFLNYQFEKLTYDPNNSFQMDEEQTTKTFGGGVFFRTYLNEAKFRFFFESRLSYARTSIEGAEQFFFSTGKRGVFSASVLPSASYRFNRVRLIANLGNLSFSNYSESEVDNPSFEVDPGYSVFLVDFRPSSINLGAEFLF